jgi:DNA-binding transcriptional MerR regulator
MRLKKSYSSREVAALTGLSARQLQWWDERRLMAPAVRPHRTAAGGFTERRYTPVDVLEIAVLADLRRRGLSVTDLRRLLTTLRDRFGIRLFEAIGGTGDVTLFTDGREVFARTRRGELFNLLRSPDQPLLMIDADDGLRELKAEVGGRRKPRRRAVRKR